MNGMGLTEHTYTKTLPRRLGVCMGFLIRTDIMKQYDVNVIDKCIDGIMGIQFKNKFTDFHFIAFVCYLPSENSPWGRNALAFFHTYFHKFISILK